MDVVNLSLFDRNFAAMCFQLVIMEMVCVHMKSVRYFRTIWKHS